MKRLACLAFLLLTGCATERVVIDCPGYRMVINDYAKYTRGDHLSAGDVEFIPTSHLRKCTAEDYEFIRAAIAECAPADNGCRAALAIIVPRCEP